MFIPNNYKKSKADSEGYESAHDIQKCVKGFRYLKGDDKQGYGKCKYRIAETLQTGDIASAPPEIFFGTKIVIY